MSLVNYVVIDFLPSGKRINQPVGASLIKAAVSAGIEVNAVCGGNGTCGKCRAKVVSGSISGVTVTEKEHLSHEELKRGYVLLCQRIVLSDTVVEISTEYPRQNSYVINKGDFKEQKFKLNPPVVKKYNILGQPTTSDNTADLDRILKYLPGVSKIDFNLLAKVPGILREAEYNVTSVVYEDELINIEKGDTTGESYGVAIDVGTTSIAGYLLDMASGKIIASSSATNKQQIHGADVISRINHAVESSEGLAELKDLAVRTIDEVLSILLNESGVSAERIYVLTLLGNTVMSHLLLGILPAGLPSAPFVPAFSRSLQGTVKDLGLKNLPVYTRFVLLPNIAGYVGSDTIGVILATGMYQLSGNWLAVDVGTNGEIVFVSQDRLLTCSTAAGPAFEGASISHGMRAEPGAISKVKMDSDVILEVVGGGEPAGICGSGLIDAVSEMVRVGLIKENGRIVSPSDCPAGLPVPLRNRIRHTEKGYEFVLWENGRKVSLTQKDISELMLGKGAIRAGIEILLEKMEVKLEQLDGILLAGAFGSNINPESIKGIGMLPDIDSHRIKSVGNAAGLGAVMALLSKEHLELAQKMPERVEHVELSLYNGFQRKFARAIKFTR